MSHHQVVHGHPISPEILPSLKGLPTHQHSQAVSAEQMLYRLARFFRQYLHCTPEQLAILSLWTVHTHCFSAARVTPYLNVCSREKQSGKSLCLELLSLVCADPWYATGISGVALLRKIAAVRPTVLLDECQTLLGGSDKKVRGLLVSGCQRSGSYEFAQPAPAPPSVVAVFCPKAFAGMAILPPAIDDRSIPIVLQATKPDATLRRFIVEKAREEAAPLLAWLKQWTAQKLVDIANAAPYTRDLMPAELNSRQQDCVEPLLHLAELIGGQVPQQARAALIDLFRRDSTQSCFLQLLSDVRNAFAAARNGPRIATSSLLTFLNALEYRPWRTWHDGEPMTPIDLARILRPFGIAPGTVRLSSLLVYKGYCSRDFVPLWERHLSEKPGSNANDFHCAEGSARGKPLPRYNP